MTGFADIQRRCGQTGAIKVAAAVDVQTWPQMEVVLVVFLSSHQPADVSLTVPFDAVHLVLVLLVGSAQVRCFGFIGLQSVSKSLLGLLPGRLLLLDLEGPPRRPTR